MNKKVSSTAFHQINQISITYIDCNVDFLVADGLCDDVTNTPECLFDGGDCCGGHTWICTQCDCKCGCNSAGSTTSDGSECTSIDNRQDGESGVCCASDGGCTCKAGYSGDNCDECGSGTYKTTTNGEITCTGKWKK